MRRILAQAFKLIKSSKVGKFVQCIALYSVQLKIHSEQGQIEELSLKIDWAVFQLEGNLCQ